MQCINLSSSFNHLVYSSGLCPPPNLCHQHQGQGGWVEEGGMVVSRQYFSLNAIGTILFAIGLSCQDNNWMIDVDDDPCLHQVASLLKATLTQWRVTISRRRRRRREAGRSNLRWSSTNIEPSTAPLLSVPKLFSSGATLGPVPLRPVLLRCLTLKIAPLDGHLCQVYPVEEGPMPAVPGSLTSQKGFL